MNFFVFVLSTNTFQGTDMIDLIISFGRRRFGDHIGSSDGAARRLSDVDLTDFDVTGIRLALRYGGKKQKKDYIYNYVCCETIALVERKVEKKNKRSK